MGQFLPFVNSFAKIFLFFYFSVAIYDDKTPFKPADWQNPMTFRSLGFIPIHAQVEHFSNEFMSKNDTITLLSDFIL